MSVPSHATPWTVRALVHSLILTMVAGPWLQVVAAPSQKPLLSRAAGKTEPNIFYTIDDSGSMAFSHAPDNIWAGMSNSIFPMMHPNDNLSQVSFVPSGYTIRNTCVVRTDVQSSFGASNLKLRSPQINKIYYDPTVRYRPWARANPTDPSYPNSSFTAARIDPRYIVNPADIVASTAVANLSTVVTTNTYNPPNPNDWCTSNGWNDDNNRPFNPAVYFRFNLNPDTATATQLNTTSNYTLVDLNNATAFNSDAIASAKAPGRTDCVSVAGKCTITEERQNFANWFTYYRTRSLLARGATSLAFGKLNDPFRLGYGAINHSGTAADGITGAPSQTVVRGVRDFSANSAERTAFFDWLYKVEYNGGTPLRRAMDDVGKYFQLSSSKGPWGKNPGTGTEPVDTHLSCRKSYHILMTDGYWNGAAASVNSTNWDGNSGTEVKSTSLNRKYSYNPNFKANPNGTAPYRDGVTGTLADVAQYYWMTDLRTDIANNLTVDMVKEDLTKPYYSEAEGIDRLDHAFWQHLTTFTVGLGIKGTKDYTLPAPPSGGWPTPAADAATAVDDLWHAAVNGRGKYLQASNPQEFQDALDATLNEIFASQTTPSGVSVSAFNISSGSKKYVPSFSQPQWTGDVTAYSIANLSSQSLQWTATGSLPAHTDRDIFVWNGSSAVPFDTTLSTTLRAAGNNWGLAAPATDNLIKFLRGDRTLEGSTYRCRGDMPGTTTCSTLANTEKNKGLIGDVVNSMPVLVRANVDMGYQFLPSGDSARTSYQGYVSEKKARSKAALFFGANDGMLHVLDDSDGKEVFAFIPQGVLPNLGRLADRNYGGSTDEAAATAHRFYVDGPLTESDAYLDGSWTNVVVGSAGAGAKSVFAFKLNRADPTNMDQNSVMWEINDQASNTLWTTANKAKLGYISSPLAVGRMKNGDWAAIFGNGMDSSDGRAYLMVVNLRTGSLIAAIPTDGIAGNGLGGVSLVYNLERVVVAAYAGDGLGRLWRFDLESTASGSWKAGLGQNPLFTGTSSQPITAAPTYLPHPLGGLMVVFGTGRLYASGDEKDASQQTIYGIWDPTVVGTSSATTSPVVGNTKLLQQTIGALNKAATGNYYAISKNPIEWSGPQAKRGWYVNQTILGGQRVITDPYILGGLAVFNTVAPTQPNDDCDAVSSKNHLMFIDPYNGGRPNFILFDTNGDDIVRDDGGDKGNDDTDDDIIETDGPVRPVKEDPPTPCLQPTCQEDPCGANGVPLNLVDKDSSFGPVCAPVPYIQRNWQQIQFFPR